MISRALAPSPVTRERVGERAVAMLQSLFIKNNFIFTTALINVISSFTNPLPSLAIKLFGLRKLPLQGQFVPQAQCMHCETPATPRVTGEGAAPRFMYTIRSDNGWRISLPWNAKPLPQFQRRQPQQHQHHRNNPKPHNHLRFFPPFLFKMMMQRRH